jgi:hypothetical protein
MGVIIVFMESLYLQQSISIATLWLFFIWRLHIGCYHFLATFATHLKVHNTYKWLRVYTPSHSALDPFNWLDPLINSKQFKKSSRISFNHGGKDTYIVLLHEQSQMKLWNFKLHKHHWETPKFTIFLIPVTSNRN